MNVHGVNDVRQTEIHTTEQPVPEPSTTEVELAIEKLKNHISPGIDQIPAELLNSVKFTNLLFLFGIRRNCLEEWKESIIVPIYKKGDKRDCSNYRDISLLPTTYKILSNMLL